MQLAGEVFQALCAVVWADGVVTDDERAALLAAAKSSGLGDPELAVVKSKLEAPMSLDDVDALFLDEEHAEFVFALACMLSASDGEIDARELAVVSRLGERLGLDAEARERAAAASHAIAEQLDLQGKSKRTAALEELARSIAAQN